MSTIGNRNRNIWMKYFTYTIVCTLNSMYVSDYIHAHWVHRIACSIPEEYYWVGYLSWEILGCFWKLGLALGIVKGMTKILGEPWKLSWESTIALTVNHPQSSTCFKHLLQWDFFIKMRVAKSQQSFDIEERWDFLFYYLKL